MSSCDILCRIIKFTIRTNSSLEFSWNESFIVEFTLFEPFENFAGRSWENWQFLNWNHVFKLNKNN